MNTISKPWCLVLALWGEKYSADDINRLFRAVMMQSKSCTRVILMCDRILHKVDPMIEQCKISSYFDTPHFRAGGYIIKLSVFSSPSLPSDMPCVYMDLDTIVIGDPGRIAMLVNKEDDIFMLPPGNILKFGLIRKALYFISNRKFFGTGNSSIMTFHGSLGPKLCEALRVAQEQNYSNKKILTIDDTFISWFAQAKLKSLPTSLAVMFRREFLSRVPGALWLRTWLPSEKRRRNGIVAVTFNGAEHKPYKLASLTDGSILDDSKGRRGCWSEKYIGSLKSIIEIDFNMKSDV